MWIYVIVAMTVIAIITIWYTITIMTEYEKIEQIEDDLYLKSLESTRFKSGEPNGKHGDSEHDRK